MTDGEIMDLWQTVRRARQANGHNAFWDWDAQIIDFARTYEQQVLGAILKRFRPLADESDGLLKQAANVIENLVDCVQLEGYPFEPADVADGNDIKQKLIDHLEKYGCSSE